MLFYTDASMQRHQNATLIGSVFIALPTILALLGTATSFVGAVLASQLRRRLIVLPRERPAVSVLKPLYGDEPALEEALTSFARVVYPRFQLILGVQDPQDRALAVIERVRMRQPKLDMVVVVEPAVHGTNRKVSNLINMLPAACHDVLVFSDSDLHVTPDYLDSVVSALERPGCGLVTTVCIGMGASKGPLSMAARLGVMHISYLFLPGVLLSRLFGRQDALGTTMALRRRTLALAGGLNCLLPHLADDHVLGRRVRALGLSIEIADTIPGVSVTENSLAALWLHELRWARTIRALEPAVFPLSVAQFPLFWATLTCTVSGGTAWSLALFGSIWIARAASAASIGGSETVGGWKNWLLWPVRDTLSAALVIASFCGSRVVWRGHVMHADAGRGPAATKTPAANAAE